MRSEGARCAARIAIVAVFVVSGADPARCAEPVPRPKYAPGTVRLFDARDFVRAQPAPDFWAVSPYYVPQHTEGACSAAAACMVVNALRAERRLGTGDELATAEGVVRTVDRRAWRDKIVDDGPGLTLDELAALLPRALEAYGVKDCRVEVVRFPEASEIALRKLRKLLAENERSARDVLVANFQQGTVTGDPEGNVGHFAPVGAWDAGTRRVLLFDPDRRWYEPYWVPDEVLLAALRTQDPDADRPRGLLRIVRPEK